jgi:hypothetical protein
MKQRRNLQITIHSENLHGEYSTPNISTMFHLRKVRLAVNAIFSGNNGYV